jgi:Flp pilus assembly protein TadD
MHQLRQNVLSLCCILSLFAGCFAPALQAHDSPFYKQGRAAYDTGRWDDAAGLMAKAEAENPGKSDALLYQGKALFHLNRLAEAETALVAYAKLHPDSANTLFILGFVQQRENKARNSLETYSAAARLRTPSSNDLKVVALDYVLLDDYPDAIHWLQRAVDFDPNNIDAWYSLGRCYYTQSRFPEAERAFNKTLALDPNHVKAAENLGLVLDAENHATAADQSFRRAITLAHDEARNDEWPYLDYGSFLIDHDRSAEAVPLLKQAVAIAPKCAECHEKLGRALAATGDSKEGIAELEEAVALTPQDAHLHYELGLAYRRAGMTDRAKAELATSAKLYGTKAAGERK